MLARPKEASVDLTQRDPDRRRRDPESCRQVASTAARAADAKSGEDTVVLAMGALLGLTDAFVITSGRNPRQVRTIVEEVERRVKAEVAVAPIRVEGAADARWVLMDYGDFLVHVFLEEAREFYDLEHLWSAAPADPLGRRGGLRPPVSFREAGPRAHRGSG